MTITKATCQKCAYQSIISQQHPKGDVYLVDIKTEAGEITTIELCSLHVSEEFQSRPHYHDTRELCQ